MPASCGGREEVAGVRAKLPGMCDVNPDTPNLAGRKSTVDCSIYEHQRHNPFYVDNTAQGRRGLCGTLSEKDV